MENKFKWSSMLFSRLEVIYIKVLFAFSESNNQKHHMEWNSYGINTERVIFELSTYSMYLIKKNEHSRKKFWNRTHIIPAKKYCCTFAMA